MTIKTVKRVFASVRAIVNLTISEEGLGCSWATSGVGKAYGYGIYKKWEWLLAISHSHPRSQRPNTQKPD